MPPPYVAPNELITSAWGNDVVDNLIAHDTAIAAARVLTTSTDVSFGNAPQGTTTLSGLIAIPSSPESRLWTFAWNYFLSGHSVGSQYRVQIYDVASGNAQAISGFGTYVAGQPYVGMFLARLLIPSSPARTTGFKIEIVTANANTNIAGVCVATGIAV